jgi:hypothetical protein
VVSEQRTPARGNGRRTKRRVTLGLAVLLAVCDLVVGVVIGYVARGGPPDRVLVTTDQEIPVLTVTTPAESP